MDEIKSLVGPAEAAEILGVKRATVWTYKNRGYMPDPVGQIGNSPVWTRQQIEAMRERREDGEARP